MSKNINDFYAILGLKYGTPIGIVRKTYYRLAKKYHPDKNKNNDDEMIKKINIAYNFIMQRENICNDDDDDDDDDDALDFEFNIRETFSFLFAKKYNELALPTGLEPVTS